MRKEKKEKSAEGCLGGDSNTNCSHSLALEAECRNSAISSLQQLSADQLKCP